MKTLAQSPKDPRFVQDPYPFYARARAAGDLIWWEEYGMPAATTMRAVGAFLRDRRFGREPPDGIERAPVPDRLAPFYALEAHSMLEAEPPRHTRLRGLVLRAFTSARVQALTPVIDALLADLIAAFPASGPFDLLETLARPLPAVTISRLVGVPDRMAPDLVGWSNAMVKMYQPGRTRSDEDAAVAATEAFTAYLSDVITMRRARPGDDLLSRLIAAEEAGEKLTAEELVSTVILLLNAGHEATVHTLGNGIKSLIENDKHTEAVAGGDALVEEVLRHDPPLHVFTRIAREEVETFGHRFQPGDQVACLLASANRDPAAFTDPDRFDPSRKPEAHASFGAGIHFCLGAPLARLEIARALPALFRARPGLQLAEPPRYADIYHFHGLERLMVVG